MRHQNNGYFKLFAKNLFSMLFEIRKHFPKPFLTFAFLNDFFVIKKSYCDVINSFLFVPPELVLLLNWFVVNNIMVNIYTPVTYCIVFYFIATLYICR